jgi:DNA adenine methylase
MTYTISPVIKWAGGKRQLLPKIIPLCNLKFDTYIEPFLGGGAVFFELINNNTLTKEHKIIISDINPDLINVYSCIKKNHEKLIKKIKKLCEVKLDVDTFNEYRSEFNSLKKDANYPDFKLAALFIFLNKSCFNGLYRLNSSNEFNVPWGKKSYNISQAEISNISRIAEIFNTYNIEILNEDYTKILGKYIGDSKWYNTFIYLDPPYYPVKSTSFVGYNGTKFDFDAYFNVINNIANCYVLTSNSNCDNVVDGLNKHEIDFVSARKSINSKGDDRNDQKEVLTRNYILIDV